jgi:hypothetical protein
MTVPLVTLMLYLQRLALGLHLVLTTFRLVAAVPFI